MTRPPTRTDWFLSVAGLSFFGDIFFGHWGLAIGPSYLLLTILVYADPERRQIQNDHSDK